MHAILPLACCVTLGWFLGISVPQFSHCETGMNSSPFLGAVAKISQHAMYEASQVVQDW